MKKILLYIVFCVLLTVTVSACGSSAQSDENENEKDNKQSFEINGLTIFAPSDWKEIKSVITDGNSDDVYLALNVNNNKTENGSKDYEYLFVSACGEASSSEELRAVVDKAPFAAFRNDTKLSEIEIEGCTAALETEYKEITTTSTTFNIKNYAVACSEKAFLFEIGYSTENSKGDNVKKQLEELVTSCDFQNCDPNPTSISPEEWDAGYNDNSVGNDDEDSKVDEEDAYSESGEDTSSDVPKDELLLDSDGKQIYKVYCTEGYIAFDGSFNGSGNFIVKVLDDNQNLEEIVCNEIGSYIVDKTVNVGKGYHYIEVYCSSGTWSMNWYGTGGN